MFLLQTVAVRPKTQWSSATDEQINSYKFDLDSLLSAFSLPPDIQYRSASLSINPAFRAGACTDCEYIECTIAIIIIVILVRSLFLVY